MRRPHDEDPSPRRTSRRGPCRPPTGACRPPGIPSTSRNTSRRQCLRGGTVRRCSPRRVVLPARCGFSPPPSTADESGAECPSALVLPALCPVRISVSSSLLAATMNQKSSLREVPQFVSWLLTGNTDDPQLKVGAHVLVQLGSELVTDVEQAILECVKNSYDADSPGCLIDIDTTE